MFYDRFAQLCAQKGITPSGAAREIGIDKSNVSQWKARGLTPRADALHRIASYFGITVDELLGVGPFRAEGGFAQAKHPSRGPLARVGLHEVKQTSPTSASAERERQTAGWMHSERPGAEGADGLHPLKDREAAEEPQGMAAQQPQRDGPAKAEGGLQNKQASDSPGTGAAPDDAALQMDSPTLPYATRPQQPAVQALYFRLAQEAQQSNLSERDVEFILSFIRDHGARNKGE